MISLFKEAKNWLLLFFLCAISTYSQDILWEKSFGGKNSEYLFDAIPTPDYGFILAGSSISGKEGSKSNENKGNYDYDYGTATLFDLNRRSLKSIAINGEHIIPIELTNIPQGL